MRPAVVSGGGALPHVRFNCGDVQKYRSALVESLFSKPWAMSRERCEWSALWSETPRPMWSYTSNGEDKTWNKVLTGRFWA